MKLAHILVCHTVDPTKAIQSIPHREDDFWYVFLHSKDSTIREIAFQLLAHRDGNVFDYGHNRGLANSWNEGLHLATQSGCDAALLLNDDLFFYPGRYLEFVSTIGAVREISRNVAYVTTLGLETGTSFHAGQVLPQSFACCAIFPETIEKIGYFDENFTPAYYEDIDYDRRAALAGMTVHVHQDVLCEHQRSSTRQMMSAEDDARAAQSFQKNKLYYEQKWGNNCFTQPFDRHEFSIRIPFSQRRTPYSIVLDDHVPKEVA